MKKYLLFSLLLLKITNCRNLQGKLWIVPRTIIDSVLAYTPEQMEGFENRRGLVLEYRFLFFLLEKSIQNRSKKKRAYLVLSMYALNKIDNIEQFMK